jgi:hypothetical protein
VLTIVLNVTRSSLKVQEQREPIKSRSRRAAFGKGHVGGNYKLGSTGQHLADALADINGPEHILRPVADKRGQPFYLLLLLEDNGAGSGQDIFVFRLHHHCRLHHALLSSQV